MNRSLRLRLALCGTIVLSVMLSACSNRVGEGGSSETARFIDDALTLRDDSGLFRMAESERTVEGDTYITALYASADPDGRLVGRLVEPEIDQKASKLGPSDTVGVWSIAVIAKTIGRPSLPLLNRAAQTLRIPAEQPTTDADVAAIWYWADTVRTLRKANIATRVEAIARERLGNINLDHLRGHPYLIWRLWDAYSALDLLVPRDVTVLI